MRPPPLLVRRLVLAPLVLAIELGPAIVLSRHAGDWVEARHPHAG